ncbi:hypothetical protein VTO42DRAFT_7490 [Malbranchea cinnamomea]
MAGDQALDFKHASQNGPVLGDPRLSWPAAPPRLTSLVAHADCVIISAVHSIYVNPKRLKGFDETRFSRWDRSQMRLYSLCRATQPPRLVSLKALRQVKILILELVQARI